jgi:hypothetical protein
MHCLRCQSKINSPLAGSSVEYHYCKSCRSIFDERAIIISYDDISYDESWDDITKDEDDDE